MKTTKSIKGSKEVSKVKAPSKKKKISIEKYIPSEEEIREKANELYLQRMERGENATAENDWIEAEKLLREYN